MNKLLLGNCKEILKSIESNSVDLVYMDPPFFTQKEHSLLNRDNTMEYSFSDKWSNLDEYLNFIKEVLIESRRILKNTGSLFLHCDKTASHYLRIKLDETFGFDKFQSEIIWNYKRWSNSRKGLLCGHQTIFFYSKTDDFKYNTIYTDYSPTTNIDQILQERERDENGKSIYKKNENGNIVLGKEKNGVPLSDVWEIPYLNPKAKERVGYPTQKPVLLLNQIIKISTDENDIVLDPFCGSGTTCVSAKSLKRNYIGIDISEEAIKLSENRLKEMIISNSELLRKGSQSYIEKSEKEISILKSINAVPVQRNNGIDGFLKKQINGKPIAIRIQREHETINEAITAVENSTQAQNCDIKIIILTNESKGLFEIKTNIVLIKSYELDINDEIMRLTSNSRP